MAPVIGILAALSSIAGIYSSVSGSVNQQKQMKSQSRAQEQMNAQRMLQGGMQTGAGGVTTGNMSYAPTSSLTGGPITTGGISGTDSSYSNNTENIGGASQLLSKKTNPNNVYTWS